MKHAHDIWTPVELNSGDGYGASRLNALRHGILSRYTVLPWEDAEAYRALVQSLVAEHAPQGPTEEHFVEELAGIFWRKQRLRLRLAEGAAYRRGLTRALKPHRETAQTALVHLDATVESGCATDAVRATADTTAYEMRDMQDDEAITRRAIDLLGYRRNDAYEAALAELREDNREWWTDELNGDADEYGEGEPKPTADAEGLRRFLIGKVLPWFEARNAELENRSLIREQALGEALDPDKLERLGRYEVHLDRKFERTLSTLLRLQELRRQKPSAEADCG